MHQINVLVFESELDEVTKAIVRLGILHLIQLDENEPWAENLRNYDAGSLQGRIESLRDRVSKLIETLDIKELPMKSVSDRYFNVSQADYDKIESEVSEIESTVEELIAEKRRLNAKLDRLEGVLSEVAPLAGVGLVDVLKNPYSFINVYYGQIESDNYDFLVDELADMAAVVLKLSSQDKRKTRVLVIGLKKDRLKLKKILREAAFEEIEISEDVIEETSGANEQLDERIAELKEQIADIDAKIREIAAENAPILIDYYRTLMVAHLLIKVKRYLKRTKKTYVFSGWIPAKKRRMVEREILRAAHGRAIIEVISPEEIAGVKEGKVKVPVLLRHPSFFRPFEMLISSYGLPDYTFIDPTIFVAVSFLVMFGMMFGDIGHGAVLALLGWYIGFKADKLSEPVRLMGRLVLYSGAASIVFGTLFGSVFGLEDLIPHIWLKPMNNIMYFFKVAVYIGITMISLGIVFNIINAIRARDIKTGLFDHAGVITAVVYWGGIGAVSLFLSNKPVPVELIVYAILIPLIIIFLKEPILAIISGKRPFFKEGIGTYVMEEAIEIMEIVMGYLANTISFIRVAAFSLAHVGLFMAVFSLVDMVKGARGGLLYSALILILGNVGIIALEGLVVTIQAIRLEYYEFFSKFFLGGGVAYKPIGLGESPDREK